MRPGGTVVGVVEASVGVLEEKELVELFDKVDNTDMALG
jgi:hypothetical protein